MGDIFGASSPSRRRAFWEKLQHKFGTAQCNRVQQSLFWVTWFPLVSWCPNTSTDQLCIGMSYGHVSGYNLSAHVAADPLRTLPSRAWPHGGQIWKQHTLRWQQVMLEACALVEDVKNPKWQKFKVNRGLSLRGLNARWMAWMACLLFQRRKHKSYFPLKSWGSVISNSRFVTSSWEVFEVVAKMDM